jgi:DNA-binding Lrp family transcriptional regulator
MNDLDALDRALLDHIQVGVPLTPQPFASLGEKVGLGDEEVLARIRQWKEARVIRQIGAIFDPRRLGYQSTLVAFHVDQDALERVAAQINAHPGVSHNYARPHHYNLWFTLAIPPGQAVEREIERLARATGVEDWLNLPALRVFKLRTHFRLGADRGDGDAESHEGATTPSYNLSPADIPTIRALQQDLPLVSRPFAELAQRWGQSEEALLHKARELESAGILRRYSAVLRHRQVGYTFNGMACWLVPEPDIAEAGKLAATYSQVSHCYQRPACPPRWPYTLFTMIHGRSQDDVEGVVAQISQATGIEDYQVLYSSREFKKERVRYFEEEA